MHNIVKGTISVSHLHQKSTHHICTWCDLCCVGLSQLRPQLPKTVISASAWSLLTISSEWLRSLIIHQTTRSTTDKWTRCHPLSYNIVSIRTYPANQYQVYLLVPIPFCCIVAVPIPYQQYYCLIPCAFYCVGCLSIQHSGVWMDSLRLYCRGSQVSHAAAGEVQVLGSFTIAAAVMN